MDISQKLQTKNYNIWKMRKPRPIAEREFFDFMAENHCRISHDFIRNLWSPIDPFNNQ